MEEDRGLFFGFGAQWIWIIIIILIICCLCGGFGGFGCKEYQS